MLEDKEELYLDALKGLQKKYKSSIGLADINYLIAVHYGSKGNQYISPPYGESDEDENKWLLKEAFEICLATTKEFEATVGASNCRLLMNSILAKNMHFETELVNIPKQPFLTKLTYKNLPKVYLRVIPFSENERESFEKLRNNVDWQRKSLEFLNTCKPAKTWSVELPDDGAYQSHSVEIPIDGLPVGLYAIVVSETEDFVAESGNTGYVFTHVSNIGYWERKGDGQPSEFVIFNRNSGQPIEGAEVEFWVQHYNSVFRKYQEKKRGEERSDKNGFVKSNLNDREDRNFHIRIKNGSDNLITDQRFYNNIYTNAQHHYQQTHFFLDRAIYRPGQTIYFKGIAMNYDHERMPSIIQNEKVIVTLRDANYQEAGKLELQSNQFGTFSGQFIAPRGGLLGNMQIVSNIGGSSKHFKVEEYKRPKFEVTFEPVKESFRLNDTVKITGKATAYAGNQIDGAQATWRVVRETHFPWYGRYWGWLP